MLHSSCNAGVSLPLIATALLFTRTVAEQCRSSRDDSSSSLVQGAFRTQRELTIVAEEEEDPPQDHSNGASPNVERPHSISLQLLNASGNTSRSSLPHAEANQSSRSELWVSIMTAPQQLGRRILNTLALSSLQPGLGSGGLALLSNVESHDFGKAVLIFMTPVLIVLLISVCSVGWCARPDRSDERLCARSPSQRRPLRHASASPMQRDQMAMFLPSSLSLASAGNTHPPAPSPASAMLMSAADGSKNSMPDMSSTGAPSNSIPKSFTLQEAGGPHLCPDLVVPEGHECTLLVPCLPPANSGNANVGHATIDDGTGSPVCQMKFNLVPDPAGRRLVLSSASGDSIFAYCKDCEAEQGTGSGLTIHHPSGNTYGVLRLEGGTYSVATRRGWRLVFQRELKSGCLNATDERGRLLAMAESVGAARRSLRIGPLVDAGLIASALLGMDLLEHERSKSTPRSSGRFGAAPQISIP